MIVTDGVFIVQDDFGRVELGEVSGPIPNVGDRLSISDAYGDAVRLWIVCFIIYYCETTTVHVVPWRAERTLSYRLRSERKKLKTAVKTEVRKNNTR